MNALIAKLKNTLADRPPADVQEALRRQHNAGFQGGVALAALSLFAVLAAMGWDRSDRSLLALAAVGAAASLALGVVILHRARALRSTIRNYPCGNTGEGP